MIDRYAGITFSPKEEDGEGTWAPRLPQKPVTVNYWEVHLIPSQWAWGRLFVPAVNI